MFYIPNYQDPSISFNSYRVPYMCMDIFGQLYISLDVLIYDAGNIEFLNILKYS